MSAEQPVLVETLGRVLIVAIDRPDQRNAVDLATTRGLVAAIERLESDDALAAGVLTGTGPGFCAGMDLAAFGRGELPFDPERGFGGLTLRRPGKPVVAAVEGFAMAGGLELALACDVLVAARGAQLGIPEVRRSLVAAAGALRRLPERLPQNVVAEMALTGDPIDAERAYDLGLVNRLTEPGDALAEAVLIAERIAENGPLAVAATRRVLADQGDWTEEEFWVKQGEMVGAVFGSEDAREGARAFKERRDPVWRGR